MNPKVSVIIPAYNTEAFIEKSIRSVLNQTVKHVEVVVVDDASNDRTCQVVNNITDSRVKLFLSEQNGGASSARNRAIKESKGDWIAVLDSDDWFAPNRLEVLLKLAEEKNADIVADDLSFIQDGDIQPWSSLVKESGQSIETIQEIDPVFFVNTDIYGQQGLHLGFTKPLFRRKFLIENKLSYNESIKVTHDYWLYLDCLLKGAKFIFLAEPYYYYRSRPGSLVTGSQIRRLNDDIKASESVLKQISKIKNPDLHAALSRNAKTYLQSYDYYKVVELLKEKRLLGALKTSIRHPYFFWKSAKKLTRSIGFS